MPSSVPRNRSHPSRTPLHPLDPQHGISGGSGKARSVHKNARSGPGWRCRSRHPSRSRHPRLSPARRSPGNSRASQAATTATLPGPGQGLLGRHSPPLQIQLHRRQPELFVEPQRDQVAHRARWSTGKRQLQLVGHPVADPALDPPGLLGRQQPLAAPRRHPPSVEHAIGSLRAVALQPDVHRLPLHADHLGRLRPGSAPAAGSAPAPAGAIPPAPPGRCCESPALPCPKHSKPLGTCQVYLWDISKPAG